MLYPGVPVAQVVLSQCEGGDSCEGRFAYHTDAHFADIAGDKKKDLESWVRSENHEVRTRAVHLSYRLPTLVNHIERITLCRNPESFV